MEWLNRLRGQRCARPAARGFLTRLARARGGNTLAMMAAALIPFIGLSGSAIDMARLYVVKVRLQQACDAGVLAGRKTMSDTSPTSPLDDAAKIQAQAFFTNNFRQGFFQAGSVSFTPVKTTQGSSSVANAVTATATATVPMALMQIFGAAPATLNVACRAVYDLADADVMFVLDTTGSMSCYPTDSANCATGTASYTRSDGTTGFRSPEKSQTTYNGKPMYSKIESLRQAVMTFDTTMRANADPSTHVRYGFVTYSSSVNVGKQIPSGYVQTADWTYQSRHVVGDYNYGNTFQQAINGVPQGYCPTGGTIRLPTTGYVRSYDGVWSDEGYYQGRVYTNVSYANGVCSGTGQRVRALWRYEPWSWPIAQFAAGNTVVNPTRLDGTSSSWRGCVEELNTTASSSFNVNSLPDDLNPDVNPTTATNKWRPIWPEAEWLRNSASSQDVKDDQISEDSGNYYNYNYGAGHYLIQTGSVACGMPAKRLAVMSAQDVHDYVYDTDFQPFGGTYHDVGMIWGTRMLAPNSVFADSKPWPGRNDPTRTIIFMTDGTMAPTQLAYGQYGVESLDNRIGSGGNTTTQYNRHVARFRVECDAAKSRGMTIYTIAVGLHGAAVPDLDYCATQGAAYYADDTDTLTGVFATIAQRVAKLRISQ